MSNEEQEHGKVGICFRDGKVYLGILKSDLLEACKNDNLKGAACLPVAALYALFEHMRDNELENKIINITTTETLEKLQASDMTKDIIKNAFGKKNDDEEMDSK